MAAKTQPGIVVAEVTNFSGGPNFRDSPTELSAVESYDAFNCSFDERGGVASRLGFQKRNAVPVGTGYKALVLASSPSLYWRLDEGVGSLTANDSSGNGRVGTYGSGVTLGIAGALSGDSDTAASFNNTASASVSASYQPYAAGSSRTFMGWGYRAATTDEDSLFGARTVSNLGPTPGPRLSVASGSTDVTFFTANATSQTWTAAWPGTGQWVHWALTYNDTSRVAELFINGVSKGTKTLAASYATNTPVFFAGLDAYGTVISPTYIPWNGYLDEITVFESILTTAAITAIYNAASGGSDFIVNDHYSPLLGTTITQCGKSLYRADNTAAVKTFTTNDCVTFAELNAKVIAAHPVDGLWYSTDGTTWTKITTANAPTTALCITVWQAKLWVGLADGTVHYSNLADPLTWTSTDFNAIWEKDQAPVVALRAGSGQDIVGRPGLLVFKQDSVYRINNSTTGAYTTLDASAGAAGPKAVTGVGSRVCWIGKHGIYWWREDQAGPVNASDLLRPVWRPEQLSYANQNGWAAGRRLNRAYFSCSSLNSNVNDIAFEFHPDEDWITPRSDAMTCYSTSRGSVEQTYGGSPTAPGQMYQLDIGGVDDVANIAGWFQTRWLIPNTGFQAQIWQVRLHGRGAGTMTFRINYESSGGSARVFDFSTLSGGFLYDNGVLYDSGATYGTVTLADSEAFSGLGACRQFSLRFDFTTDTTAVGRQVITTAPAPVVGAFGLYGLEVSLIPLGYS